MITAFFQSSRLFEETLWQVFRALYHVLEQISEFLPLVPDLFCGPFVFPVLARVVALHELADVFPHHVIVQPTRQLLLPENTHTHTHRFNAAAEKEDDSG